MAKSSPSLTGKLKRKSDVFASMPWNSVDEYHEFGRKYGCWGLELKKEVLKHMIPEPKIKKIKK